MKKQARMMQEQMGQMRAQMQNTLTEGSSGSGLVTVTLNGEKDLKKITIKQDCLTDVEALQDLIVAAFEDAARKVDAQSSTPKMPFFG